MAQPLCIAIDGPVASGKTVVGKELARRIGTSFMDTGAMYRAVTWAAINKKVSPEDTESISKLAFALKIELRHSDSGDRLLVDGEDMTEHLRDAEVDHLVSAVSAVSGVRKALVEQQRHVASQGPIVMVGRDIGTVVLPNAQPKIFLLASAEVRAKRRHREQEESEQGETTEIVSPCSLCYLLL